MLVSLTVGKVDAGVAVLLTEDKRLIEFPSILLPNTIQSGSIVDITVSQNHAAEAATAKSFSSLQSTILDRYGMTAPSAPVLRLRNATQTSLVLEWDPISLATSTLRSLALYRNGQKAGNIPRPHDMLSTKISGLAINTEYSFFLVLRTSGGTFTSNTITTKTHEMTNLTGITVTPGVLAPQLHDSLVRACERIDCKIAEKVRIDTTHFVCTEPRGTEWQKAVDMNIPIVRPEWIEGCEREGKIVGVRAYYLDADPKLRIVGTNPVISQQQQQAPTSTARTTPPAQTQPPAPQKELPTRPQTSESEESRAGTASTPEVKQGVQSRDSLPEQHHPEEDRENDVSEEEEEHITEKPRTAEPKEAVSDDEESDGDIAGKPAEGQAHTAKTQAEKGEDMEDVAL